MIQEEKDKLLALFANDRCWCQGSDARNQFGLPVRHDDNEAVAWDLVGGMYHLFGWKRTLQLSLQMGRHFFSRQAPAMHRNPEMFAMAAMLDFNDAKSTTYELVMEKLHDLPVWQGKRPAVPHPEATAVDVT